MVTAISFTFDSEKEAQEFRRLIRKGPWAACQLKNGVYVQMTEEATEHVANDFKDFGDMLQDAELCSK